MSGIGRNDPCPCGSGRKYKQCCLLRESAAASASDYTRAERDSAWAAVGDFVMRPEFAGDLEIAHAAFFEPAASIPGAEAPDVLEDSMPFFEAWLFCDFPLRGDRTAIDVYLDREGSRLRSGERRYLERVRDAELRAYEVTAARPGEGLDLVDLLTGGRVQVLERSGSRQLVAWDVLATRVMVGGEGVPVMERDIYVYPQALREPIVKELKRAQRGAKRARRGLGERELFRGMAAGFYALWLAHVRLPPLPRIVTPEGDRMTFARVVFDVHDGAAVRAALDSRDDMHRQDDDSHVWVQPGPRGSFRSLGVVVVQGKRLVFEATSRQRAERGRAMIEALAGAAVSYRATSLEDVNQALARHGERAPKRAPRSEVPPEVAAEVIGKFMEQHYGGWLDQALPALDGRTPREAAASKSARPKLVSLLKQMESMSERDRRQGRPAYDFGWMWAELGITRPE